MDNQLYLDKNVAERLQHFSSAEVEPLLRKLELVQTDPLSNSEPVQNAPDLRITGAGDFRVIFTYREADHIVMVTEVDHARAAISTREPVAA